ncbi:402_t:CDS:1 [Funneliformis geosporum]|nr:402_t:CDS:1 [Funneliformis geosporum]
MVNIQQKNKKINEKPNEEEFIFDNNSFQVLKKAENSAINVAKYLLSLDPKNAWGLRKYFTLRPISFGEEPDSSQTREGNFRLNKILHMCQIFHCIEYNKPLFRERMEAYENGAIVYKVRLDFMKLWNFPSSDLVTNFSKEVQNLIHLVYNYFRSNYEDDNNALRNFSHQDPA